MTLTIILNNPVRNGDVSSTYGEEVKYREI